MNTCCITSVLVVLPCDVLSPFPAHEIAANVCLNNFAGKGPICVLHSGLDDIYIFYIQATAELLYVFLTPKLNLHSTN